MKKLILLFIIVLGFVCDGKAQIASSSEVHYYICTFNTDNPDPDFGMSLMFVTNGILFYNGFFSLNEKEINKVLKQTRTTYSSIPYDSNNSTAKYFAYRRDGLDGTTSHYYFVSKDKNELISVVTHKRKIIQKQYFKRVTKEELLNQNKPNFDFLE